MENYYRRHLPHYQPPEATYFTTFRLAGSLPAKVIKQLLLEREERTKKFRMIKNAGQRREWIHRSRVAHLERLEKAFERSSYGPHWLQQPAIAEIVELAIKFRDGTKYDLYAYCLMPNHVHLVFNLLGNECAGLSEDAADATALSHPVTDILGSLKKHTALEANRILGRRVAFWRGESYDHVVRDGDELERILWYVILNPVKARLVKSWQDWKWSCCKPGLLSM
jgi:putative transposase